MIQIFPKYLWRIVKNLVTTSIFKIINNNKMYQQYQCRWDHQTLYNEETIINLMTKNISKKEVPKSKKEKDKKNIK